jgi:hypothetical protein
MDILIEVSTRDVVLACWDRVAMAFFKGTTTAQSLRRAGQMVADLRVSRQEQVYCFTVVEETASLPSLDVRMEIVSFLKGVNGAVDRSALVFEGEGFRAASVRAVVAGVSLFSRTDFPHRVFASVGAAARFISGSRSAAPTPHHLIRAVQQARRTPSTQTFPPWMHVPVAGGAALRPR